MYLVAIGSLRPLPGGRVLLVSLLSLLSLVQARLTRGCASARVFEADGRFLSMTVWTSPAAMKRFARTGPHRVALRLADRIAETDRFVHYQTASLPTLAEGRDRWRSMHPA